MLCLDLTDYERLVDIPRKPLKESFISTIIDIAIAEHRARHSRPAPVDTSSLAGQASLMPISNVFNARKFAPSERDSTV